MNRLGYLKLVEFTKKRERWKLGEIEFEVDKEIIGKDRDTKINLGSFCQATLETEKIIAENEVKKVLWEALEKLGYNTKSFERDSYTDLFLLKKNDLK